LNLVCYPEKMQSDFLGAILAGGAEKLQEAGALLAGGHSIYDSEPKYGLAVTGIVAPHAFIANNTAQIGDCLILTKALGVGIIQAAHRVHLASETAYQAALSSMERLNREAAQWLQKYKVHA